MRRARTLRKIAPAIAMSLAALFSAPETAGQGEATEAEQLKESNRLGDEILRLLGAQKLDEAVQFGESTLAQVEKDYGRESAAWATFSIYVGLSYKSSSRYSPCVALLKSSKPVLERAVGPESPLLAMAMTTLGVCHINLGEYKEAESLYRRALAILERSPSGWEESIVSILSNLAQVEEQKGNLDEALALTDQALARAEKLFGPDAALVGEILNNRALFFQAKGEYHKAEPLFERATKITLKLGPENESFVVVRSNLATLYLQKGDFGRAELLLKESLATIEKVFSPAHPSAAYLRNHLSQVYEDKKDYDAAVKEAERAFAIAEKAFGENHKVSKVCLGTWANALAGKGDLAKAREVAERERAIGLFLYGPDHLEMAMPYNRIAELDRYDGRLESAYDGHRRALAIRERALGPEHPDTAEALLYVAKQELVMGRRDAAVKTLERAIKAREKSVALTLTTGSEEQKQAFLEWLDIELFLAISMDTAHPAAAKSEPQMGAKELAMRTVLSHKGRSLDAMADMLAVLRRRLDAEDRALFDELGRVQSKLATLITRGPRGAAPKEHVERVRELEAQRQELTAKMSIQAQGLHDPIAGVSLAAVRAALPEGSALVEIAVYEPFNTASKRPDDNYDPARYAAYVLPKRGAIQRADLGPVTQIDRAAAELIKALAEARGDPKGLAREVDKLLMQPVRSLLGDVQSIFISPDGALHLIPFGALVDEQGRYLIDRFSFTYLTSGRDLVRPPTKSASGEVLIVAAPDFGPVGAIGTSGVRAASASRGRRSIDMAKVGFKPLKDADEEGLALKELIPNARLLRGPEATEGALKAARRPAVLHIATHGFFLEDQPGAPGVLINTAGLGTEAAFRPENPLLRAGLALAGANARSSGNEDGILTALEASSLDLLGTQLVVLSACETGVGEARNGAGVYGLKRALVLAGSETQVLSLWEVDDQATQLLMSGYYERLLDGEGRVAAMEEAQRGMKRNTILSHPHYWASFTVSGSGAALDGVSGFRGSRGCMCSLPGAAVREGSRGHEAASAAGLWVTGAILGAARIGQARRRGRRKEKELSMGGRTGVF